VETAIHLDSMVLSYLAHAMAPGYEPGRDPDLDSERIAALRLLMVTSGLGVGNTAAREALETPDHVHRVEIQLLIDSTLLEDEVLPELHEAYESRVAELQRVHPEENDCRILAEAEMCRVRVLLTFDKTMQRRLAPVANVEVVFPSVEWDRLAATSPRAISVPHPTNPLSRRDFWKWS